MKNALPRVLAIGAACTLALTVSACSSQEGVPGVPGLGGERNAAAPSVSVPTAASIAPLPTDAPATTDAPASSTSGVPTDDPFATQETTPETSQAPSPTAPSTPASTRAGGLTDKYKADQAVCGEAYKATYFYDSSRTTSDFAEVYSTRAEMLGAAAEKATIPEVKEAITSLQTFNVDLGEAYTARDADKLSELSKKASDRSGTYYQALKLLMTCRYGMEMGN